MNEQDLFLYVLIALSGAMLFFMYRSNKKRQAQAREMQDQLAPGAEVMTNFGMFGKVVSIDRDDSKVVLAISASTNVTIHIQAIGRVVEAAKPAAKAAAAKPATAAAKKPAAKKPAAKKPAAKKPAAKKSVKK